MRKQSHGEETVSYKIFSVWNIGCKIHQYLAVTYRFWPCSIPRHRPSYLLGSGSLFPAMKKKTGLQILYRGPPQVFRDTSLYAWKCCRSCDILNKITRIADLSSGCHRETNFWMITKYFTPNCTCQHRISKSRQKQQKPKKHFLLNW
jgi:hypothetical protein